VRNMDLILQPGDSLEIPAYDGTVQILGAVGFQSRTRWRPNWNLGDYLNQAGGVAENGDRNNAVVTYANHERQRSKNILIFRTDPGVEPGSTISVPFKEQREGGMSADQLLARLTGLGTLVVLFDQLRTR
jgi:polysaccharide export outer membrane protein